MTTTEGMPIWIEMLLHNSAAYTDFVSHMGEKVLQHQLKMEEHIRDGNLAAAQAELGSKETYGELFNELTRYESEMRAQVTFEQERKGGVASYA